MVEPRDAVLALRETPLLRIVPFEDGFYLNAGDAEGQTNFNSAFDWRMLSYLFRTNYTLLDRYLFTGSMRVDGSSRFGSENRYGWFPSVAVGWDLARESFLILPHAEVLTYVQRKADDYDRWLTGMQRFQKRLGFVGPIP